jgi:hypothetical protein
MASPKAAGESAVGPLMKFKGSAWLPPVWRLQPSPDAPGWPPVRMRRVAMRLHSKKVVRPTHGLLGPAAPR